MRDAGPVEPLHILARVRACHRHYFSGHRLQNGLSVRQYAQRLRSLPTQRHASRRHVSSPAVTRASAHPHAHLCPRVSGRPGGVLRMVGGAVVRRRHASGSHLAARFNQRRPRATIQPVRISIPPQKRCPASSVRPFGTTTATTRAKLPSPTPPPPASPTTLLPSQSHSRNGPRHAEWRRLHRLSRQRRLRRLPITSEASKCVAASV